MLHYNYLLGGDTVAPSGLYAWLCHAFKILRFLFIILKNVTFYVFVVVAHVFSRTVTQVDTTV